MRTSKISPNPSSFTRTLQGAGQNKINFILDFSSSGLYNDLAKDCYISEITLKYKASCTFSGQYSFRPDGNIYIKSTEDEETSIPIEFGTNNTVSVDLTKLRNSNNSFYRIYFQMTKHIFEAADVGLTYTISNVELTYKYIGPIILTSSDSAKGPVSKKLNNISTGSVTIAADTVPGYHLARWSDGNTTNPRTMTVSDAISLTAIIEPNTYTLRFYDSTSGSDVLYDTVNCTYDDVEKLAPPLPERIAPEGYIFNPIGWCPSKTGRIREGTTIIKDFDGKELTQHTRFQNYTQTNNDTLDFYCNFYPKEYYIYYRHFRQNNTTNYTLSTGYRAYQVLSPLKPLPILEALSRGYKLSNQITSLEGPIDKSITNSWFISPDAIKPGDPTIISIDPNYMGDIDVYCYEVPIVYTVNFHTFDQLGTLLNTKTVKCTYNIPSELPPVLEGQVGKGVAGWYTDPATNIQDWYLEPNSETDIANDTIPPAFPANKVINVTKDDQAVIDLYGYYVPKSYLLEYKWLDNWGQGETGFELPVPGMWIYGKDPVSIATIPTNFNEYYDVENQGTIKWYYKDASGDLVLNTQTELSPIYDHNITFYAKKEPKGRTITVSSNRADWGTAYVRNPKEGNQYEEGDEVEIYAVAADGLTSYFSHWSDGDNHPVRKVKVGAYHKDYKAIFRSLQIFAPVNYPINENIILLVSNDEYILFDRDRLRLISDEEEKNND